MVENFGDKAVTAPNRRHRIQSETDMGEHYHGSCHCGIYTFHETARMPGHYRANLGCIDEIDTFSLEFDLFDGKHLL